MFSIVYTNDYNDVIVRMCFESFFYARNSHFFIKMTDIFHTKKSVQKAMSVKTHDQHDSFSGSIELICGPMFSGKTTQLIRMIHQHENADLICLMIKYDQDVRYDDTHVVTHDQIKHKAECSSSILSSTDWISKYPNLQVICIDEGQFFDDIDVFSETMANRGLKVIVAALSGDYRRQYFDNIMRLIPLCDYIQHLNSICKLCKKPAAFSFRTNHVTVQKSLGGSEQYMALCRQCYIDQNSSIVC